jgi:hypothetical protein
MRRSLFVATIVLAGCSTAVPQSLAERPAAVEARGILDTLARGDLAAVAARLDESQRSPDANSQLAALGVMFPRRAPTTVRLVDYRENAAKIVGGSLPSVETTSAFFESNYDGTYVLSNVVLRSAEGGPRQVVALHAQSLPASIEDLNAFSIGDMGFVQYAILLAMVAAAATTVVALRVWFRRRQVVRRRWWWLLGILVGAFKISVNWKTGGFAMQALTVQLFSVSAARTGISPWILSFSIPAGAIAFLVISRQASRPQSPPPPANSDVPAV